MDALTWDDVAGYARGCGPAHLATVSPTGEPHVSVVFPAVDGPRLWLTMRTSSAKHRNLVHSGRAAIVWQGNGAETYVWARAVLRDDPVARRRASSGGIFAFDLSGFYDAEDGPGWALAIAPSRATVMLQTETGLVRKTWSGAPPI